jgi:hypothetical protein
MAHAKLAGQPLLLLMLALYDADGNALRRFASGLDRTDLYEELLTSFARREVLKRPSELVGDDPTMAIEEEMRRLSIVALAMFNRSSQWVTEGDLEQDLNAIFGRPAPGKRADLRAPTGAAEQTLGVSFSSTGLRHSATTPHCAHMSSCTRPSGNTWWPG